LLLEQGNKDFIKGKRKGKENDVIGPWGRDFIKGKGQKKKEKDTLLWSTTRSNKIERKICIRYTLQTLEAERR
jgi:hypothetical protein